jgi:peroxiredoxin
MKASYILFALFFSNHLPDSTGVDSLLSIADYRPLMPSADTLVYRIESNIRKSIGSPAPDLNFTQLDDSTLHNLAEYRTSIVLLVFWNTYCQNCYADVPAMNRLQKEYSTAGLRVLYLSSDDPQRQSKYAKREGIVATKGILNEQSLLKPYQCVLTPMAILVDRNGIVRDGWLGLIGYDASEQRMNRVIPQELKQRRWKREATWATIALLLLILGLLIMRSRSNRRNGPHTSRST